jgi:hypothetical protein
LIIGKPFGTWMLFVFLEAERDFDYSISLHFEFLVAETVLDTLT